MAASSCKEVFHLALLLPCVSCLWVATANHTERFASSFACLGSEQLNVRAEDQSSLQGSAQE